MSEPIDQPPEEKSPSSEQKSSLENNCPIEKSEAGDDVTGGGGGVGGGSSSSLVISARKRGRADADVDADADAVHAGYGSGSKEMKKGGSELPRRQPTCYVCKKGFGTWKAVFGHLKAHQRQTPGAFPPPPFTPPKGSPENNNLDATALKDQLAPTLLNLAYETMHKMSQDEFNTGAAAGDASSSMRDGGWGLDFDLNDPGTSFLLDLNKPPPPEKDDDDDEEEDDYEDDDEEEEEEEDEDED